MEIKLKNKMRMKIIFLLISMNFIISCQTRNPYPGLQTHNGESTYYTIENSDSNKLIIYLEGSGYESVLGRFDTSGNWEYTNFAEPITKTFSKEYNILVPEKLMFKMGQSYKDDKAVYSSYRVDELVLSYTKSIDTYLSRNIFSEVYIIGASEGGYLLPAVYKNLKNKNKIDKLVFFGSGGFSQLEELRILGNSKVEMPDNYRAICQQIETEWVDIQQDPNSVEKFFLGHPYSRWSSFFLYKPIEDIRGINIPALFIQGELDWSTPVESTKMIENEKISDKFKFIYYEKMEHGPSTYRQMKTLSNDMKEWLLINE